MATGVAATTLFLVEGVAASRLSQGELEVTRFLMRAAYLLGGHPRWAQLASAIAMSHIESEVLSGLLARVKRGDGFTGTLRDVLDDFLRHSRARLALLVLKDEDTGRAVSWRLPASTPASQAPPVLTTLAATDLALLSSVMPSGASMWGTGALRAKTMRVRAIGDGGTLSSTTVPAEPQQRLLTAESAHAYTAVRLQVATWTRACFSSTPHAPTKRRCASCTAWPCRSRRRCTATI